MGGKLRFARKQCKKPQVICINGRRNMLHASRSVRYFEATSSVLLESLTAMTSLLECFTFLTQVSSLGILLFDVNGSDAECKHWSTMTSYWILREFMKRRIRFVYFFDSITDTFGFLRGDKVLLAYF